MVIHVGDLLAGFLGGGVERCRRIGAVELRERDLRVEPVDGGG